MKKQKIFLSLGVLILTLMLIAGCGNSSLNSKNNSSESTSSAKKSAKIKKSESKTSESSQASISSSVESSSSSASTVNVSYDDAVSALSQSGIEDFNSEEIAQDESHAVDDGYVITTGSGAHSKNVFTVTKNGNGYHIDAQYMGSINGDWIVDHTETANVE